MNAAIDHETIAAQTYAAMCAPPPHVVLAQSLVSAANRAEREALLAAVDDTLRNAALAYIAEPEPTRERDRRLEWMRQDARRVAALRHFYSGHTANFICDWMTVTDSRRVARGQTAVVPFKLWPKQRELVGFILERISTQSPGVLVKGRDVGATAVSVATLAALCVFRNGFAAGILSATEAKLDRFEDTIFDKLRGLLRSLPPEFAAGYDEARNSMYLSVEFPDTRSSIQGATGSNAFRGLRKTCVLVDEAAYLQDSQAIDSALAAVSEARIDISTPHGIGGSFYDRAHNPAIPRMNLTWRDDPRRDQAWYEKQVATLDPVVLGQEINADFSASREGTVLPALWIQSAIGLCEKLGITPTGARYAALDLGDQGDRSALAVRHGPSVLHVESWSGAGSDLLRTASKAFTRCDAWGCTELLFDADGMGASMRGDARVLNDQRPAGSKIRVIEYRGSESPINPDNLAPRTGRMWKDLAANRKAQAWLHLRNLFQESHKAARGEPFDRAAFISLNPKIPELSALIAELSQPTMSENATGKILIDKRGSGERSPDRADSLAMAMAPRDLPICVSDAILAMAASTGRPGTMWGANGP